MKKNLITLFVMILFGCGGGKQPDQDRLNIVATTGMIGDAAKAIAGELATVTTLMGPGVDPHLYKATKGDLDAMASADAIFYNGLHLEAKMAEILESMSRNRLTVGVGAAVPAESLRHSEQFAGAPDPHVWFDVSLWQRAVDTIAAALIQFDSAHATAYRVNADAYLDSLRALDTWVRAQIGQIPPDSRVLVTAHDAFGYFGRAYGIEVHGLQGISTVTEAGLYDVTQMIDFLVERKIKAVFVESSVAPKTIEAVVEGCRARSHQVAIGGQLYSDAMGSAGTPEGTYLGMVRHNVNTIVAALR